MSKNNISILRFEFKTRKHGYIKINDFNEN